MTETMSGKGMILMLVLLGTVLSQVEAIGKLLDQAVIMTTYKRHNYIT